MDPPLGVFRVLEALIVADVGFVHNGTFASAGACAPFFLRFGLVGVIPSGLVVLGVIVVVFKLVIVIVIEVEIIIWLVRVKG
jgi:uncharacterized membrane protein